jgi:HPt (histidine-containing phosphotransfer) domain-containing protein
VDNEIIGLKDVLHRLQDDKELLLELVQIFLDDAPHRLDNAKRLIEEANAEELADVAHSLKGAASNIGANKLWQSFKEMEQFAKEKNFSQAKHIFQKASLEFIELQGYFPQLKSQLVT